MNIRYWIYYRKDREWRGWYRLWLNIKYMVYMLVGYDEGLEWVCIVSGKIIEIEWFMMKVGLRGKEGLEEVEWYESGVWWRENKDKMSWWNKWFNIN
jgi:hypothetical protein